MAVKDYLILMRIQQWIKNFFVFAAIIFSSNLFISGKFVIIIYTFLIFCAASSSVYIINDLFDISADRNHPTKKHRPLASKKIKKNQALILLVILLIIALYFSYSINLGLMIIISIYLIMNLLYSVWLKHMVILDVLIVAIGYVLRVIAGGIAINVGLSPWLLGMTLTLSMILALAKRHSELVNQGTSKRKVLEHYDIPFINLLLVLSSTLTITIYLLWCIENRLQTNPNALIASSFFIFYGIIRYLYLTLKLNKAESPTKLVLKDRALQINILLWLIYMIILIYL